MVRSQGSVRGLPLLEGEQVEERFVPYDGLVADTPWKGPLLVLTNKRVVSFDQSNGQKETLVAPLEELRGVSVKADTRGLKDLMRGLILMPVGVFGYLVLGYIMDSVPIGLALGAAIVFVGLFFIARHLLWEEEGSITFEGGRWEHSFPNRDSKAGTYVYKWELSFPYKSNMASGMVYSLVNRFFQLKRDSSSPHPPEEKAPEQGASEPPSPPAYADTSYDI